MHIDMCYGGVPSKVPENSMGIRGYDFVEFYVGSAKMIAYWHAKAMGCDIIGYRGPETGVRDRISYLLKSHKFRIIITSALQPGTHEINSFTVKHGDGFKRWSLEVTDVKETFEKAVKNGGIPVNYPCKLEDEDGFVEEAAIRLYDDAEIVFTNYDNYNGFFRPGYGEPLQKIIIDRKETGLKYIDHVVGNVRENEMEYWANYINKALDFETTLYFGPGDISTQYSALISKVVKSKDSIIRNPINEPYVGKRKSQIEEYILEYHGTGIQHIAIGTDDIVSTVSAMRKNGVDFLTVPDNYFDKLREKDFGITESIDDLQENRILCDIEGTGYLLQIFTKPISDRPTFFYEVIQRRNGATGFGHGNFQTLFESIERDQELRGNLV